MLIWTAKFSTRVKAVLAVVGLGALAAAAVLLSGGQGEAQGETPPLTTNAERVSYLTNLGWQVELEPVETLQFLLPETLEEPYLTYNQLQLTQGFDLTPYCGAQVERYTYTVTNYPGRTEGVQANLYLSEGQVIAGDILSAGADGFQSTLDFPAQ